MPDGVRATLALERETSQTDDADLMINDDERPRAAVQRLTILPLDELGVGELEAYAADLRAEIVRVEAAAERKRSFRDRADAVFGRSNG